MKETEDQPPSDSIITVCLMFRSFSSFRCKLYHLSEQRPLALTDVRIEVGGEGGLLFPYCGCWMIDRKQSAEMKRLEKILMKWRPNRTYKVVVLLGVYLEKNPCAPLLRFSSVCLS